MGRDLQPTDIHELLGGLTSEAQSRRVVVAELAASVTALRDDWRTNVVERQAEAVQAANRNCAREQKSVQANAADAFDTALGLVGAAVENLSPGFLGASRDAPIWVASPLPAPRLGSCVRIGALAPGGASVLAPLLSTSGWSVVAGQADFAAFAKMVALRLFYALGPDHVNLSVYDPDFVMDLGDFAEIKRVSPRSVRSAVSTEDAIQPLLDELIQHVRSVVDDLTAEGYGNLLDGFVGSGRIPHPLQILVIASSAGDFSEKAAKRLSQLIAVGRNRGLVVISHDSDGRPHNGAGPGSGDMVTITLAGPRSTCSSLGGLTFTADSLPDRAEFLGLSSHLASVPKASTAPKVDFAELNAADLDAGWVDAGDQGVEAVIGRVGRHPLIVRLRSENPPMPNVLIGGAVGQGKSNLLLVLIHSLASRYAPTDLELVLLDFKDGVEFSRLGPDRHGHNAIPHIRAMGLEFDVDFGIAALQWAVDEMAQRAEKLRDARAVSLAEYRAQGFSMPRIVIVIDEFQRLFEGDDDTIEIAATLLERIARTGRSFGVHIVLSSQTISGIRGLAAKSDAIFGQFHNRISLKNKASESAVILAPQNTAASDLRERGEVIVNESFGEVEANVKGVTAYAEPSYLSSLRAQMWTMGGGRTARVFRASEHADWPGDRTWADGDIVIGSPISLDESVRTMRMRTTVQQSIALLGPDAESASLVIAAAVRSQMRFLGKVVILDGAGIDLVQYPTMYGLVDKLRRNGVDVDVVSGGDVSARIVELARAVEDDSAELPDLVVMFGLDSVVGLEETDPETYVAGTDRLQRFLEFAGRRHVMCLAWWQVLARLRKHTGFEYTGIRAFVLCGTSKNDIQDVCGPLVRPPRVANRVIWMDRTAGSRPEVLVPFADADDGARPRKRTTNAV